MNERNLHFEIDPGPAPEGSVGVLTLDRPLALNALNRALIEELEAFVSSLKQKTSLRCLIVTGAGEKAFVAGADIKEMLPFGREEAQAMAVRGQKLFQEIENLPIATIAAVNGFALGGGLELAMACDFIVAAKTARFGLPEVSLGLIPGYGGTQRLPRYVGKAIARLITLSGELYPAQKGYEWGLFAEVTEPQDLKMTCLKIAKSIASRGPKAVSAAKFAIRQGFDQTQQEGLALEAKLFSELFATEDRIEGLSAFIDKRPPRFQGK